MVSFNQVQSLASVALRGGRQQIRQMVLQLANNEKLAGHAKCAASLENLLNKEVTVPPEITRVEPSVGLQDVILSSQNKEILSGFLNENRNEELLEEKGLSVSKKVLLEGASGCGKTLTASAIAGELGLPLYRVNVDMVFDNLLGNTARKLRKVFDAAKGERCVLFIDEFDSVGSKADSDVGEMGRVVNSLLVLLQEHTGICVVATCSKELLFPALLRRFEWHLTYTLPGEKERGKLSRRILDKYSVLHGIDTAEVVRSTAGASYDNIEQRLLKQAKRIVLAGVQK